MKLEDHPFVQSLAPDRRAAILAEVSLVELPAGEMIFDEQTGPDALYLLLEGKVAFTKHRSDGSLQHVSEAGSGSFFGEVGVFTGKRRALGAVAIQTSTVCRIPEPTAKRIIKEAEPLGKILESVIQHLNNTTEHYLNDVMRTEKLTLVGTMVSSILHDFKNPFSVISLGSHIILQRHGSDPKTAKICENMETQIRRMVHMANDLAAFARGESDIEISEVRLNELFSQFRDLNDHFFTDARVRIEMTGNGCALQADAGKLLRVLQNLVSNAIEALFETEIDGLIEVVAREEGEQLVLSVADNGPGIPADIRENFFEPFVTRGKNDGTGLGSAIVKSFVNAHRGTIHFETSAEGTCFTIRLPRVQS